MSSKLDDSGQRWYEAYTTKQIKFTSHVTDTEIKIPANTRVYVRPDLGLMRYEHYEIEILFKKEYCIIQ